MGVGSGTNAQMSDVLDILALNRSIRQFGIGNHIEVAGVENLEEFRLLAGD